MASSGSPTRARIIQAPTTFDRSGKSVFLAGSIAGGNASNWQTSMISSLSTLSITILNPRRADWDSSWVEDISCAPFKEQVEWELYMQEAADVIAMYFDPNTQAPISLLELGMFAPSGKMVVCCPEGFWKRGNVQIVCKKYGINLVESLEELVDEVKKSFE